MLLIMISSGPLAGGHLQSLGRKNQRKDESWRDLASPAPDLLPVVSDHEQDQDHEQEGGAAVVL
jgi:hypothetical protein